MATSTTRRQFVKLAAGACSAATLHANALPFSLAAEQGLPSNLASDPRRPQFHLLPAKNWMNDPNGPIYYNKRYHMFLQYNPEGATSANKSWAHAISDDMLHWRNYSVAFVPTPGGPDAAGCFSGSAFIDNTGAKPRVCAVYTGVVNDKEHETIPGEGLKESQCIAWSDDPMLLHWKKDPQPIVPNPPPGMKVTGFRDPSAWNQNGVFYMTVGSGIPNLGGCVLLYRSHDLRQWEYMHPLIQGTWTGSDDRGTVGNGTMWECPEFFPLDGAHVLIYSSSGKVFWLSGKLDEEAMRFEPKKGGILDLDAFYAPKTHTDAQGRRILWGWIPERRTDAQMIAAGWSGMTSLPRVMNLDSDGNLRMTILPETKALRGEPITMNSTPDGTSGTLAKSNGEVLLTGTNESSIEFTVSMGGQELLKATYDPKQNAWIAEGRTYQLQGKNPPTIHAYADGSIIETMLSEELGYTKRFYYTEAIAPDLTVRASGSGIHAEAWAIKPISPDRLTTSES
ncbi:glycoside hydrolase family 32 protein [Silvibacterium acidisoli]|uniref:glycoside hydrolase family 32 protein n=1 Tax=Acidobacteriaceae bacterium ZG23-2 TaxID=2883246 RepID=UPI00406CBBBC